MNAFLSFSSFKIRYLDILMLLKNVPILFTIMILACVLRLQSSETRSLSLSLTLSGRINHDFLTIALPFAWSRCRSISTIRFYLTWFGETRQWSWMGKKNRWSRQKTHRENEMEQKKSWICILNSYNSEIILNHRWALDTTKEKKTVMQIYTPKNRGNHHNSIVEWRQVEIKCK